MISANRDSGVFLWGIPLWTIIAPVLAVAIWVGDSCPSSLGEPYGTLVLALAVTLIEVAMIACLANRAAIIQNTLRWAQARQPQAARSRGDL
jgi:Ca2+/H+ antiporter